MIRKNFLIISFFVLVVSVFAKGVPEQRAKIAAESFLHSRLGNVSEVSLIDFPQTAELPNLYFFGNERSFVIIAGDDCVHPVLGYSIDNCFGSEDITEDVFDWMKMYDQEIAFAKRSRFEAQPEIRNEWVCLLNGQGLVPQSRTSVSPLVRTKWKQRTPFNDMCPTDTAGIDGHAAAGCGAIALAQIMNYWEHPVRGVGSHSYTLSSHPEYGELYADFGATTYDWDYIRNFYSRGYTDAEALAVAALVYHCGVSVNMNYGPSSSGVNPLNLDDALKTYFDYSTTTSYLYKSSYSDLQWHSMLKNELDSERPVIYRGCNEGGNVAHIFICDGYDENNYFHFNWGHAGDYDGYFLIGALNPGSANYSYGNAAIFGCYPNAVALSAPANVNAEVVERNVTITWSSVDGASFYKLYRDGDLIANNLTETSYLDSNVVYGNHAYYLKSVESDGIMSLKSNSALANVRFQGPIPTSLQGIVSNHDVNLSWGTPISETAILQYGVGSYSNHTGYNNGTYWGQRFAASCLCDYAGMAIEKVSAYFLYGGDYTLYIYKGDDINTNELVCQQDFIAMADGWQDIVLPAPVFIDYTRDLWVVLYSDINKPITYCQYSESGNEDATLYSNSGIRWSHSNNRSWLMKTHITDGSYTYNLYRDGNVLVNSNSGNTYTDANVPDGFYEYHVTTNYYGGESAPSNSVYVQVGDLSYAISVTADPIIGGTVTGGGTYTLGQICTLEATPATGYTFVNWTREGEEVSIDTIYSFAVVDTASLVAHFVPQTYNIVVSAEPAEGGRVDGGGTFGYGQQCVVHALANDCYAFDCWTENGMLVQSSPDYTFTVEGNRNLVANFKRESFSVDIDIEPEEGGSAIGAGSYYCGDTAALQAIPNENYIFLYWVKDGVVINNNPNLSFAVNEDTHLIAQFSYVDGIAEYGNSFEVYPNPGNERVCVKGDGIRKVTVLDVAGRIINAVEVKEMDQISIDVHDYEAACYFLCIQTENGLVIRLFVKC